MASSQREFKVTLPSNASMNLHPQNRPNHYVTELASPIHLDGDWEVALVDIQFTHSWNTVLQASGGNFALMPLVDDVIKSAGDLSRVTQKANLLRGGGGATNVEKSAANFLKSTVEVVLEDARREQRKPPPVNFFVFENFNVPAGYYSSARELGQYVASVLTEAVDRAGFNEKVIFKLDPISDKGMLAFERPNRLYGTLLIGNANVWTSMLGFAPSPHFEQWQVRDLPLVGINPIALEDLYSVYVYSDIVSHQLVGDTLVPLMGVVPIQGQEKGKQLYWSFNPPYYMSVTKNEIKSIEMQMNTDRGAKFPFLGGKVCSRLHFRHRGI